MGANDAGERPGAASRRGPGEALASPAVSSPDVGEAEEKAWREHFAAELERSRPQSAGELLVMLERDCARYGARFERVAPKLPALVACILAERAAGRVRVALRRLEEARERRDKRERMLRDFARELARQPVVSNEQRAQMKAYRKAWDDAAGRVVAGVRLLEQALHEAESLTLDAEDAARACARLLAGGAS